MTVLPEKDSGYFKTGDLVIGSSDPNKSVYSATGSRIMADGVAIYGDNNDLSAQAEEITLSAMRSGGTIMTQSKNKKSTKKSSTKTVKFQPSFDTGSLYENNSVFHAAPEPAAHVDEPKVILRTVQFENDFGKIRAKAEQVIEHEHAFLLVFSDEDSMVFEPKTGESLAFHTDDRRVFSVYYPGVTFDWPASDKKFMILFKLPEENQE